MGKKHHQLSPLLDLVIVASAYFFVSTRVHEETFLTWGAFLDTFALFEVIFYVHWMTEEVLVHLNVSDMGYYAIICIDMMGVLISCAGIEVCTQKEDGLRTSGEVQCEVFSYGSLVSRLVISAAWALRGYQLRGVRGATAVEQEDERKHCLMVWVDTKGNNSESGGCFFLALLNMVTGVMWLGVAFATDFSNLLGWWWSIAILEWVVGPTMLFVTKAKAVYMEPLGDLNERLNLFIFLVIGEALICTSRSYEGEYVEGYILGDVSMMMVAFVIVLFYFIGLQVSNTTSSWTVVPNVLEKIQQGWELEESDIDGAFLEPFREMRDKLVLQVDHVHVMVYQHLYNFLHMVFAVCVLILAGIFETISHYNGYGESDEISTDLLVGTWVYTALCLFTMGLLRFLNCQVHREVLLAALKGCDDCSQSAFELTDDPLVDLRALKRKAIQSLRAWRDNSGNNQSDNQSPEGSHEVRASPVNENSDDIPKPKKTNNSFDFDTVIMPGFRFASYKFENIMLSSAASALIILGGAMWGDSKQPISVCFFVLVAVLSAVLVIHKNIVHLKKTAKMRSLSGEEKSLTTLMMASNECEEEIPRPSSMKRYSISGSSVRSSQMRGSRVSSSEAGSIPEVKNPVVAPSTLHEI
jgi:hypothetical protein